MHQLYLGDCHKIMPDIMDDVDNPVIVTDPPFNIRYHYRTYKDSLSEDKYYARLFEMFMYQCPVVVVGYPEMLHRLSIEAHEVPERVVSWVYPSNTRRQHRDIAFYRITPDFSKVRQPYRNMNDRRVKELYKRTGGAALYDWFEINQVKNVSKEKTEHPCQMPVKVMENVIGTLPDDMTIVDPYMGSGTTGVAALNLNRRFVGIEMDEQYYEICERRLNERA